MLIVADTSSLVALAAAESLDLLDGLFQEVRVPTAVETELLVPGKPQSSVLQEFLRGKVIFSRPHPVRHRRTRIGPW